MRAILLTRDGRHYVLCEVPATHEPTMISGRLTTGGEVVVPVGNVAAIEVYQDRDIEAFRIRKRILDLHEENRHSRSE